MLAAIEYPYGSKVEAPTDLTPTRESDGEFAYEFAGWDEKLTWYIKRDMTYTATYTSRELTADEKEEIADALTQVQTYADTQINKIVIGELSMDEWDGVVEKFYDMGLDAAYQRYLAAQ